MMTTTMTNVWRGATHEIEFSIERTMKRVVRPTHQQQCSPLVSMDTMTIPCLKCSPFEHFNQYLEHYQQLVSSSLLSSQNLPQCCANQIALSFAHCVLRPANTDHRCCTLWYTFTYFVKIAFQPVSQPVDLMRLLEEDGPVKKPTSPSYVLDLIASRSDKYEGKWNCSDHECSICIDDIDKYHNSLTLPCLHMFHQTCIVRWLEKNHVCPLCRFEMPTQSSRIES